MLSSDRFTQVSAQFSCKSISLAQETQDLIFLKGAFLKAYLFFTSQKEKKNLSVADYCAYLGIPNSLCLLCALNTWILRTHTQYRQDTAQHRSPPRPP